MKILMLTYEIIDKGGSFMRCFSLAKNLVTLGHDVTILASNSGKRMRSKQASRNGVRIVEIPCVLPRRIRHSGLSPFQILGRSVHVLKQRYDIVHGFGHRPASAIPPMIHRLKFKVPYVADWGDLWGSGGLANERRGLETLIGIIDDPVERQVYKKADGLTVICNDLKKRALAIGIPSDKIELIPVGANVDSIRPLSKKRMRQKYRLPPNPIAVFVGITPIDAELLGKVFVELCKIDKKALLVFAGTKMQVFEKIIKRAGIENRVIHKGFIPNDRIEEILACGDVMLLPYSNRAINIGRSPHKIGDYMAAGKPTVTNPTGDLKKLFIEEKIGLLAESPHAFAQAVEKLLANPALRERLGRKARKVAETKLSWQRLARDLDAFYQTILASS